MHTISAFQFEFERHRRLAERGMAPLADEEFFFRPAPHVNSIALVVKHLSGNLNSRWSHPTETDGDKPDRDRDQEFLLTTDDSRAKLMAAWASAWATVDSTLGRLRDDQLEIEILIRGEPHSLLQALVRGATHAAYHVGQILYLARLQRPDDPWLTIEPGKSRERSVGSYLRPPQS